MGKSPAVAPANRIVVQCATPFGNPLADVEVTVDNLRPIVKTPLNGRVEFTFTDAELSPTSRVITVRAHKHHFGRGKNPAAPNDHAHQVPVSQTKNPVLQLEMEDVALNAFTDTFDSIHARELTLEQARNAPAPNIF